MNSIDAINQAVSVLKTEANVLAALIDDKSFAQFPHRVEIAIHSEMERLRAIASALSEIRTKQ